MADQQNVKLQEREYRLYKEIQVKFREVVDPLTLSDYLVASCLTEDDVDRIKAKFQTDGRSKSAGELLDRLRRRPNWVYNLLLACSHPELGLDHLCCYIKDKMIQLEIRPTTHASAFTQQGRYTQSDIEEILAEFKSRVDPEKFVQYLKRLTEEDEEVVKCKQQQSGKRAAAEELVFRLLSNYKHWKDDLQEALKCRGSGLEDLGEKLSEIENQEWIFRQKIKNLHLNADISTEEFTKRRTELMREFLHEHFLHGKSLDEIPQIIRKADDVNNLLLRLQLQREKKMKEKKLPDSVFHKMTSSDELKDMFRSIESVLFVPKDVEQMSFADDLLKFVHSEKVVLDLVTLSNTPNLRRIKNVSENEEPGTICVFDVDVVLKKDHLEVQKWNPLQWIDESHIKSERVLNVILVHSKSLRVVETKLRVYKEFESLFGSKSTMPHLQHENEEYDEIAKKSAKAKVSSFRRTIHSLIQSISSLDILSIVSEAIDQAFSLRNVRDICLSEFISDGENVGTVYSNSYTCRFFVTVRRIKNTLVKNSLRTINKSLGSQISGRILQHIESKLQTVFKHDQFRQNMNITDKIFATITVGMEYFADPISNQLQSVIFAIGSLIETFINTVDVNSSTWRRKVAEEIVLALSKNKEDILQKICLSVENIKQTTTEDLHNVSEKLEEWEKNIKCVDIDEVVPIWKKREAFKNINGLGNHKSVLNLIAGIKNDEPTLKVFLRIDDQNAKRFIKDHPEIPKETNVEFVVVISNKEQRDQAKTKNYPIEKNMREKLSKIIKSQGERIHANHSGVVGLGIGNMDCNGPIMPCIIIYCLDKDLVPFGEKPLPKTLEGFRCDIREDFIMFGACFDCHEIAHPNPGCCIGLPSNGIGSAGFLAKTNELGLETSGFLTAAHVAAENWTDLYNDNAFLSELEVGQYNREIVHPLLPNDNSGRIIGKVKESFCGNWGPDGIGIDAAFVQNYEQDKAAYRELKPADESELDYDNQLIVLKRGGTTGQTFGRLIDKCYSPSVNPPVDNIAWGLGRFYFFDRCFAVEDINGPFFNLGDSGSGVFLTENGHPTKPLGIAFAKLEYGQITVVCRIAQVTKAFNLRLYEIAEPMDTSLQMQ